ncbi:hypothetical protein BJ912DRAFT_932517 [Pholiota molesta]|nr:hypothetical protein BJ912DRAFT_932517 [Pholiota molesta]
MEIPGYYFWEWPESPWAKQRTTGAPRHPGNDQFSQRAASPYPGISFFTHATDLHRSDRFHTELHQMKSTADDSGAPCAPEPKIANANDDANDKTNESTKGNTSDGADDDRTTARPGRYDDDGSVGHVSGAATPSEPPALHLPHPHSRRQRTTTVAAHDDGRAIPSSAAPPARLLRRVWNGHGDGQRRRRARERGGAPRMSTPPCVCINAEDDAHEAFTCPRPRCRQETTWSVSQRTPPCSRTRPFRSHSPGQCNFPARRKRLPRWLACASGYDAGPAAYAALALLPLPAGTVRPLDAGVALVPRRLHACVEHEGWRMDGHFRHVQ